MSGDYRIPILLVDEETGLMDQLDRGWTMEDFYSVCTLFRLNPGRLLHDIENEASNHINGGYIPSKDFYVRIDVGAYRPWNRAAKS